MARMIPPSYGEDTPLGEKLLFDKLKKDPRAQDWVVLHSLDLKKHERKIESEIDMVVLVPQLGILCIEVKGSDVRREEGVWDYGYERSAKSPFKQASTAMHALRKYLASRDNSLNSLVFFSAVFFTRVEFSEKSSEWHPWQYVSKSQFEALDISENIENILSRAHVHLQELRVRWYDPKNSRPTDGQITRLERLLRNKFDYQVSFSDEIKDAERQIAEFTDEQFESLDTLTENRRVIVKGPAGTGKTYLAMEMVRRARARGQRVLFLCFNRLLGDWLSAQFADEHESDGYCGTLHSYLLRIAKIKLTGEKPTDSFWKGELPEAASAALLDSVENPASFDLLVLDEAQDVLTEEYLTVLDLVLEGGLKHGRWCFFGDFEKQAIYRDDLESVSEMEILSPLKELAPEPTFCSLRRNCRNARPISDLVTLTCDLNPGYKSVLDISFADVKTEFYSDDVEQQEHLRSILETELRHFDHKEIVVLSTCSTKEACFGSGGVKSSQFVIDDFSLVNANRMIRSASVHAFKGLEAPVIVLTDVDSLDSARSISVLYVGMSRAKVRLYLLLDESCRDDWNDILDKGL